MIFIYYYFKGVYLSAMKYKTILETASTNANANANANNSVWEQKDVWLAILIIVSVLLAICLLLLLFLRKRILIAIALIQEASKYVNIVFVVVVLFKLYFDVFFLGL